MAASSSLRRVWVLLAASLTACPSDAGTSGGGGSTTDTTGAATTGAPTTGADDGGATGSSSAGADGPTTTTATSAVDGTAGTTGASTGTGGPIDGNCVPDGACRLADGERCTCPECRPTNNCTPLGCTDNGVCEITDGCYCDDCVDEPECADFCMKCDAYLSANAPQGLVTNADLLCAGESAQLFETLRACTCDGACADACADTACASLMPDTTCYNCLLANCDAALSGCTADFDPFVFCNPVTNAPCMDGEVCDRAAFPFLPGVRGFSCYPDSGTVDTCGACDEGSNAFCHATMTCSQADGTPDGTGTCARYCCDDGDCGSGTCLTGGYDAVSTTLGVCDVGTGAGPGCDAPATAASMGSCIDLVDNGA